MCVMPTEEFKGAMVEPSVAPRMICVGTHHKTGTLWMRWIFRKLAEETGLQFGIGGTLSEAGVTLPRQGGRAIIVHWSSDFTKRLLRRDDARFLHLIRDPRDVLLSGMSYHRKIDPAREAFLAQPIPELEGRTYQEQLNWLSSDEDRLLFEMRGKHAQTLSEMLAWDYTLETSIDLTYETLIADTDGILFEEALVFLGFTAEEAAIGRKIFIERSLFGPMKHTAFAQQEMDIHIQSGQPARWKTELPRSVAETYAAEYGEALVALGYEDHPSDWLEEVAA